MLRSGVGTLAAKAMGSTSAHIFYDQLFVKEPGTTAPTPWHNDTSYWHVEGKQICSVWVALDEVCAAARTPPPEPCVYRRRGGLSTSCLTPDARFQALSPIASTASSRRSLPRAASPT